jgi:hypothetical protein
MATKKRRIDPDTLVLLKQIGIGFSVLSVLALLITGVWYGTRLEALTIQHVQVEGGETLDHQVIQETVNTTLAGTYLGLIPKRFTWFYPKQTIVDSVESIDRVYGVETSRVDGQTLHVSFLEFTPTALWCERADSTTCLFLDEKGYAFAEAPNLLGGSLVRFVTTGEELVKGQYLTDEETLNSLLEMIMLLEERAWYVSHVELDQVGDVFVFLSGGGELKTSVDKAPTVMVANLMTVIASPDFAHLEPGNFNYLDLRFGNKVYLSEEEVIEVDELVTEVASSSTSTLQTIEE